MSYPFKKMSKPLQDFWGKQKEVGNVKATPRSGSCMLCAELLTNKDIDHSVCNVGWEGLGEDEL